MVRRNAKSVHRVICPIRHFPFHIVGGVGSRLGTREVGRDFAFGALDHVTLLDVHDGVVAIPVLLAQRADQQLERMDLVLRSQNASVRTG